MQDPGTVNPTIRELPCGEAQDSFRQLLDSLPAGAYTCDPEGYITYFNQQAVQLWGRSPSLNDSTDRFCGSFKLFEPNGSPLNHDQCWMAKTLATGQQNCGEEIVIERPDGSRVYALAHANPLWDDSGQLQGAVNVLVDITERKRAEETQHRLTQELRDRDRYKDEFIAMMAHELRNPLAPISTALHILSLADDLSPSVVHLRDIMERQVRHMIRLVDELLEASRLTQGRIVLKTERVELSAVIASAVETSRPMIESAGQKLIMNLPNETIYLNADFVRLAQVITTLLNNAAKFSKSEGSIRLSARREDDTIVIHVQDEGIGIPQEMLTNIFAPFVQVNRALGGVGLGLYLAKSIVQLHGGQIEAHSEGEGKGSEFIVRIPL